MSPQPAPPPDALLQALRERLDEEDVTLLAQLIEQDRQTPPTRSEEAYQAEKLAALGSLLAGVSHELNNPLSIITAQAELLELEAAGTGFGDRAGKIRRAAERAARIVQTFLAMARRQDADRQPVALAPLIDAALEVTGYGLRTGGIAVVRTVAPDLPPVTADPGQLQQVLVNLVLNAQQAMQGQPGPHCLTLTAVADPATATVTLDVADTGPGVPADLRRRIFEPFFTTRALDRGSGVGLSFSQGIAEAHGGRLDLLDTATGAVFRLTLPAAPAAPAILPATPLARPRGRTALVVDDEPELAESLGDLLQLMGFAITACDTGAAARATLLDRHFDLIVSDLRMPDIDGPALFAWLRTARPDLVSAVAFSTGDTLSAAAARFLGESGRPFMEKPFTLATVRTLVEAVDAARVAAT